MAMITLHSRAALEAVFDPTGAGDDFAGGFMLPGKTQDIGFENSRRASLPSGQRQLLR